MDEEDDQRYVDEDEAGKQMGIVNIKSSFSQNFTQMMLHS